MSLTDDVVILLTTVPEEFDVGNLARVLVEERLAACVSALAPMQSVYRWNGSVETATERQVLVKTTRARVAALETRLKALHPYEVPELLMLAVDGGSTAYLDWVRRE